MNFEIERYRKRCKERTLPLYNERGRQWEYIDTVEMYRDRKTEGTFFNNELLHIPQEIAHKKIRSCTKIIS